MMNPKSDSAMGGMLALIAFVLVIVFFSGAMLFTLGESAQARVDAAANAAPHAGRTVIAVLPTPTPNLVRVSYAGRDVSQGKSYFGASCSGCHGSDASGITGIGKDLVNSEFVNSLTDLELREFIIVGRRVWDSANTTGIDMPARGGNPALTDHNIDQIIAFLRSLRDPSLVESGGELISAMPNNRSSGGTTDTIAALGAIVSGSASDTTPQPTVDTLAALSAIVSGSGSNSGSAGTTPTVAPPVAPTVTLIPTEAPTQAPTEVVPTDAPVGNIELDMAQAASDYAFNCAGCHGADGKGVPGVGSNLNASTIIGDDAALTEFLLNEVRAVVPSGAMPHPRLGQFIPLPLDDVQAIVDYTQSLVGQ